MKRCMLPWIVCVAMIALMPWAANDARAEEIPDERLVQLMRSLTDEAFRLFVVQDESRRVYGMAYEFSRDGQQIQDFGLDAMHDGAWLMSALITAHRVDPEGKYLERAQRFQVPFYVNMLTHSDRLFPRMIARPDQEKFEQPIKGWAPRGWDDGQGIDLVAQRPFSTGVISHENGTVVERDANGQFEQAYFTSSHHLFQDLADSLMNVWLTTRDPEVARAILLIHENRMKYGLRVPVVQTAAGLTNDLKQLYGRPREPQFDPAQALRPLWQGLVLRQAIMSGRYDDGLAWTYRDECARAALSGEPMAEGFVANGVGRMYAQALATAAFYGREAYRHGFTLDTRGVEFAKDTGKFARQYDGKSMLFSRGIQLAWIAAALRTDFQRDPSAWTQGMRQLQADGKLATLQHGAAALGVEFATEPEKVSAYLNDYVVGTIGYWSGVRERLGYLPRAYRPDGKTNSWSQSAELGAYAHLIKTAAFQLMAQRRVSEWELIRQQAPTQPLPHTKLPAKVLKAQGLE